MSSLVLPTRLEVALHAAKEAGKLILSLWSNDIDEEFKADCSPVTMADKSSEELIRKLILGAFPDDGFIGEEFERTFGVSGFFWSCDPIDGTWSYLNHEDTCTVCLALHEGEETLLSVVYNPFTGACYYGGLGIAPMRNKKQLPLVHKTRLDEAVVNFFISDDRVYDVERLFRLRQQGIITKLVSQGGSIAHSLAQVACGINSVFVGVTNKHSNIWDLAGGIFLIRKVGGRVTDLNGEQLNQVKPKEVMVASSHPHIHEEVLGQLNGVGFGRMASS